MAETQDTQTGKTTSRARGRPRAWTDRTDQTDFKDWEFVSTNQINK